MRRRICIVGTVISAVPLVVGVAIAPAAKTKAVAKPKRTAVTCSSSVTTQIPDGATAVIPPVSQGTQYGTVRCGKLGPGLEADAFTVPDSGNVQGQFAQYFAAGSVHGKFDLTPQEGPPLTTTTFQGATYTGTFTVSGGTGIYARITGKGTLTCSSPDTLHLSCTERGTLTYH